MKPVELAAHARKITFTLFLSQSLSSGAFINVATVSAIIGAQLSGAPMLAGLPSATVQFGAALASLGLGIVMDRLGRRVALTAGFMVAILGGALAFGAILWKHFPLFLVGLAILGLGQAAAQLGRFAAAEVHPPKQRGRAISNVVIGGTVGAVLGPLLVAPSGRAALSLGYDELSGPFLFSCGLFLLSGAAIFFFLRPEPRDLAREISAAFPETRSSQESQRSLKTLARNPAFVAAVASMVLGQVVMVMLMGITSLHMKDHMHLLSDISVVISSHTLGMFAFSIISGRLADWWGRGRVILLGAIIILISCLLAPLSPDVIPLAAALFLLGLGWNFCYVGGSTLLSDVLTSVERARIQGANDLLIGLSSAVSSITSGIIFSRYAYAGVGIAGIALSLVLLFVIIRWMRQNAAR